MSTLPLYLVSKLAGQHVKVVLSGDGGDELFAGYPTYQADRWLRLYKLLPMPVKKGAACLANQIPISSKKMSFESKVKRFMAGAPLPPESAHASWRTIFYPDEINKLLREEAKQQVASRNPFKSYLNFYAQTSEWDELSRHQYADIKVWMAGSILAKVDFMSMAHSLEVRVPFLDYRLVEFVATIPSSLRLQGYQEKYILREAVKDLLPRAIVQRKKSGFNIPVGLWFRNE